MKINKIYSICENIMKITDEEIEELRQIYEGQLSYTHPFKMATAENQHKLGEHNKVVIEALVNLRETIRHGAEI